MQKKKIIVIGGGPAGLFASLSLSPTYDVTLIEKNNICGKKLLMTGAGKCNITQAGKIIDFLDKYGDKSRFVRPALLHFTNQQLLQFFNLYGLGFNTMENGKIFPDTMQAVSVLDILINVGKNNGVKFLMNTTVEKIVNFENDRNFKFEIITNNGKLEADKIIIATGGLSYPVTGSTGDGYKFAKDLGHKIIPTKPALTSVKIKNYQFSDLSGSTFDNIDYSVYRNNKKIHQFNNRRLLFTHTGLSGPGIFIPSRYLVKGDLLRINFLGGNPDQLRKELTDMLINSPKKTVKSVLLNLAPLTKSFIEKILELADIGSGLLCSELRKDMRNNIITLLIDYPFEIKELGSFNVAQVTAGGVSTLEVSPKNFESRIVSDLYFIGEVLDVDGDTGGYNIQAAMSMAKLCADQILNQTK